ncbi:hypothetical protein RCL_jg996.t1 [Rhizophagus clarus]|uniref:Uncharacterized protein n=1 Tax=Rhizophagus clarus TaxID=94130 RepID=A0A8H3R135_9GLOM|nr:hypothetical protein RCL_jg996.t1 [Rhizophagus clarus]
MFYVIFMLKLYNTEGKQTWKLIIEKRGWNKSRYCMQNNLPIIASNFLSRVPVKIMLNLFIMDLVIDRHLAQNLNINSM